MVLLRLWARENVRALLKSLNHLSLAGGKVAVNETQIYTYKTQMSEELCVYINHFIASLGG